MAQNLERRASYPSRTGPTACGLGLVATEDLDAESVVEVFDGPIARYEEIPEPEIRYALLFSGDEWVIPQTNARYINHSCDANCYVSDTRDVVTARRVSRGEELTIVYNGVTMEEFLQGGTAEYFWDARWTFACGCQAGPILYFSANGARRGPIATRV